MNLSIYSVKKVSLLLIQQITMNACITLSTALFFFSIYKSNFDLIFRSQLFFFIFNFLPSTVYSDEEESEEETGNRSNENVEVEPDIGPGMLFFINTLSALLLNP